ENPRVAPTVGVHPIMGPGAVVVLTDGAHSAFVDEAEVGATVGTAWNDAEEARERLRRHVESAGGGDNFTIGVAPVTDNVQIGGGSALLSHGEVTEQGRAAVEHAIAELPVRKRLPVGDPELE